MTSTVAQYQSGLSSKSSFVCPTARSLARAKTVIALAVAVSPCSLSAEYWEERLSRNCPSLSRRLRMSSTMTCAFLCRQRPEPRSSRFPPHPLHRMSCRWVFLQKVKIMPGVFDGLLLISVDRIDGIFQPIIDCFLGCFNFVQ